MSNTIRAVTVRRQFGIQLLQALRVVWPILAGLIACIAALGIVVAWLEGWSVPEGIYFAFVSGLTIGYGDLAPQLAVSRVLAVCIGFFGIVLGGLIAAIGVNALHATQQALRDPH